MHSLALRILQTLQYQYVDEGAGLDLVFVNLDPSPKPTYLAQSMDFLNELSAVTT